MQWNAHDIIDFHFIDSSILWVDSQIIKMLIMKHKIETIEINMRSNDSNRQFSQLKSIMAFLFLNKSEIKDEPYKELWCNLSKHYDTIISKQRIG